MLYMHVYLCAISNIDDTDAIVYTYHRSQVKDYIKMHQDKQDGIPTSSYHGNTETTSITNTFSAHGTAASSQSMTLGNSSQQQVTTVRKEGGNELPTPPKMNATTILVMLLRLRQCCGHLSLMKQVSDDRISCSPIEQTVISLNKH